MNKQKDGIDEERGGTVFRTPTSLHEYIEPGSALKQAIQALEDASFGGKRYDRFLDLRAAVKLMTETHDDSIPDPIERLLKHPGAGLLLAYCCKAFLKFRDHGPKDGPGNLAQAFGMADMGSGNRRPRLTSEQRMDIAHAFLNASAPLAAERANGVRLPSAQRKQLIQQGYEAAFKVWADAIGPGAGEVMGKRATRAIRRAVNEHSPGLIAGKFTGKGHTKT